MAVKASDFACDSSASAIGLGWCRDSPHFDSFGAARAGTSDGKLKAVELDHVAGARHATDQIGNEPAHCHQLDTLIDTEDLEQFARLGGRATHEHAVCAPKNALIDAVALVLDFADDLFEHVLERDQTLSAAVLIDHDRDVSTRLLKRAQHLLQRRARRDYQERSLQGLEVDISACG